MTENANVTIQGNSETTAREIYLVSNDLEVQHCLLENISTKQLIYIT